MTRKIILTTMIAPHETSKKSERIVERMFTKFPIIVLCLSQR
jgi:hypothetical protein